jgi:hypothetical protein
MSMNCEIRVPRGPSSSGQRGADMVGPVSSFLKDSELYYSAVWKHIKVCGRCDPAEILRGFLANRDARHRGQTSTLLVEMAEKYGRAMPDRVPAGLVREFVIRGMTSWDAFADRVTSLSSDEIVRSHDMYVRAWKREILDSAKKAKKGSPRIRRAWPFQRGQGSVGWLNDKDYAHLGLVVPEHVRKAAALTREEAMAKGGWDLMVWLITRHNRETAMADPDVQYVLAVDLAEDVMDG